MAREDDLDRPKPQTTHLVGEPLDVMSIAELELRITLLQDEIARLEAEIRAKQASRGAADAFFKR